MISPLLVQLGTGGMGGFLVGYAVKKVTKLVGVLIGLGFIGLQYLAYKGVVQINYHSIQTHLERISDWVQTRLLSILLSNLPLAGSFVFGFALGFDKG